MKNKKHETFLSIIVLLSTVAISIVFAAVTSNMLTHKNEAAINGYNKAMDERYTKIEKVFKNHHERQCTVDRKFTEPVLTFRPTNMKYMMVELQCDPVQGEESLPKTEDYMSDKVKWDSLKIGEKYKVKNYYINGDQGLIIIE